MKRALLLAIALACCAGPVLSQGLPGSAGPPGPNPTPKAVRWGKWVVAGMWLGLTVGGVVEHHAADDAYNDLQQYCFDIGPCTIGPDGRYLNPEAETRYQDVVQGDRTARALFVTGQVALAGAAALFVVELLKEKGTHNIPFNGLVVAPARGGGMHVGWSLKIGSP